MFLRNVTVKKPTGTKILVHYCRDCNSTDVEIVQTCKKCGSHNIASPFSHKIEDYNGVGVKQEMKDITMHFYQCDVCGKEFDGLEDSKYIHYDSEFYPGKGYTEDYNDVVNFDLELDLCNACRQKLVFDLNKDLQNITTKDYILDKLKNMKEC